MNNDYQVVNFLSTLREDLELSAEASLVIYIIKDNLRKQVLKPCDHFGYLYSKYKSEDGFLYLYYQDIEAHG